MAVMDIRSWSAWAPGVETAEDWLNWAKTGTPSIQEAGAPGLSHLPPLARRRLSQLSKMVLETGHKALDGRSPMKMIFCSRFGEINQQQKITKKMIESSEVLPASFSLSVFNTPVSLLSIHEKIRESASVHLSGNHCLITGLISLISQLKAHSEEPCLIIFADEALPGEYKNLTELDSAPFAFALIVHLNDKKDRDGIEYKFSTCDTSTETADHPLDFLRWYLQDDSREFILRQGGTVLELSRT